MYARRVGDRELTFDFAEGLLDDNLLVVDRETSSVWSQLEGRAISGPLEDTPLVSIPSLQTTWKFWRELHPDTEVATIPDEKGRPYFYRNRKPGVRPPRDRTLRHDTSALGLGLVVGGESMFFPFSTLHETETPLNMTLGGQKITIYYKEDALTAWGEDRNNILLDGVLAYQDGWLSFFPDTRILGTP